MLVTLVEMKGMLGAITIETVMIPICYGLARRMALLRKVSQTATNLSAASSRSLIWHMPSAGMLVRGHCLTTSTPKQLPHTKMPRRHPKL